MKKNPANEIKYTEWKFLMEKGQKSNISALKEYVYDLIQMTTQKTAGQRKVNGHINWDELDMTIMSIVIEATALVLSGDLDKKEADKDMNASTNASWIPVEERLPEDGQTVLCTDGEYVYLTEYDADLDAPFGDVDSIIAWRPLPEPYHPERSDNHDGK